MGSDLCIGDRSWEGPHFLFREAPTVAERCSFCGDRECEELFLTTRKLWGCTDCLAAVARCCECAIAIEAGLRLHHAARAVAIDNRNDGYGTPTAGHTDDDVASPRASVTWTVGAGTHVWLLVSEGFRSGGVASALLLAATRAYGPEHAWNYECFVRQQTPDGRFWAQANAYFMDWRAQQVSTTLPGGVPGLDDVVVNAGRSQLHGFELETGWRFAPHWSAFASRGQQIVALGGEHDFGQLPRRQIVVDDHHA